MLKFEELSKRIPLLRFQHPLLDGRKQENDRYDPPGLCPVGMLLDPERESFILLLEVSRDAIEENDTKVNTFYWRSFVIRKNNLINTNVINVLRLFDLIF